MTLERYAHLSGRKLVIPPGHMAEKTCRHATAQHAEDIWEHMYKFNNQSLEIFTSQTCFHGFMTSARWWKNEVRPVRLALMRDPWTRWLSAYRYTQKRCKEHDPLLVSHNQCGADFQSYTKSACETSYCSVQFQFMRGGHGTPRGALSKSAAEHVLDQYDLVLLLEFL